ncbi:MAG: hypothetical protein ACOYL9_12575 [Ilumatobacteraceae bacterium]
MRSVLADAADAGDESARSWRSLADLVRAGWSERWRTRPPLHTFIAYRFELARLRAEHHPWMFDDVRGALVSLRVAMSSLFIFALMLTGVHLIFPQGGRVSLMVGFTVGTVVAAMLRGNARTRKRILERHGYDPQTFAWRAPRPFVPIVRTARATPVVPVLWSFGLMLGVLSVFSFATLWWPGMRIDQISLGDSFSVDRTIDHVRLIAFIAALAAIGVGVGAFALRSRARGALVGGWLPPDVERRSAAPAVAAATWVFMFGVVVAVLPVAPAILPAAFVVSGGLSPSLLLLARETSRRERLEGTTVWWVPRWRRQGAGFTA